MPFAVASRSAAAQGPRSHIRMSDLRLASGVGAPRWPQRPRWPRWRVRRAGSPRLYLDSSEKAAPPPRLDLPPPTDDDGAPPARLDLPPPTEDGGALAWLLPLSLLAESRAANRTQDLRVGEDAGAFMWRNERWGALGDRDWLTFSAAVGTILAALALLWINPTTGYGDNFVAALERLAGGNSLLVTLAFGILFPLVHSGLAYLR